MSVYQFTACPHAHFLAKKPRASLGGFATTASTSGHQVTSTGCVSMFMEGNWSFAKIRLCSQVCKKPWL